MLGESIRRAVPRVGGLGHGSISPGSHVVYQLEKNKRMVYIGRTRRFRLRKRLREHRRKRSDQNLKMRVIASFDDKDSAVNFERELISDLRPALNRLVVVTTIR